MPGERNIYFISDLHLGMYPRDESLRREKLVVRFLDEIADHAAELWMLGDIFDYWFEYSKVVPRGFTRFLGKLAALNDAGVKLHLIPGNHDIWVFNYLSNEIGLEVHRKALIKRWNACTFFLGHGDGLHRGDYSYRILQKVFKNRLMQWFYARIHPNGSISFAHWWSKKSRMRKGAFKEYLGAEHEHQVQFARSYIQEHPDIDFFIFGHRHIPFDVRIAEKSRVIGLGDWIGNFTYGVFDGKDFHLKKFLEDQGQIITE